MRTSPGPGVGVGTSFSSSTSGPPRPAMTMARMPGRLLLLSPKPMAEAVVRPIVRSFKARFSKEAAAHVRAGGHAVVWETEKRALLVLPPIDDDDPMDLAQWSLLDLGKNRYGVAKGGVFRGLSTALV